MMDKHDTHYQIKECILLGLKKITDNDTSPIDLTTISFIPAGKIQQALEEQQEIGWNNFYRGRISTKWLDAQRDHANLNTNQCYVIQPFLIKLGMV